MKKRNPINSIMVFQTWYYTIPNYKFSHVIESESPIYDPNFHQSVFPIVSIVMRGGDFYENFYGDYLDLPESKENMPTSDFISQSYGFRICRTIKSDR